MVYPLWQDQANVGEYTYRCWVGIYQGIVHPIMDDMTNKHWLENKTKVLYLSELSLPFYLGESIVP
jgi:hypothetical protein